MVALGGLVLAALKPARKPTDEMTILLDFMTGDGYSESQIANAKAHPEHWAEELIQAKADLTGRA
jgi:exoribonuclease R